MATFQTYYQKLNPAQKQAVDTIEGPVMVIAGPGTGKTQILTLRIAKIMQETDTPPSGILALTFTEAGVHAMRKRLVELIGASGYQVGIFTFHSFCNDLIRRYPDAFPRIIGSTAIAEIDKLQILEACILDLPLAHLKPYGDPLYYLRPLAGAISELKRENISPEEAKQRAVRQREAYESIDDLQHEKGPHKGKVKGMYAKLLKKIEKNEELAIVYARYEEELRTRKQYDYEDMIVETVSTLASNPDLLLAVQEEYLYILADEHQDANNSQNRLLELLGNYHDEPNLFLVGDAKQAIYRFQGASLENFLYFKEHYPNAMLIQLERNYRSRQGILDSSYSLIEKGKLSEHERKAPLKAHLDDADAKVEVAAFSLPEYEFEYVARSIKRLLDEGVSASEIAVLYRNNGDVDALTPALARAGIPYLIESDRNVLNDDLVRGFVTLLKAVAGYGGEELLSRVLFLDFLQVAPLDIYKLMRARHKERTSIHELLGDTTALARAGVSDPAQLRDLARRYAGWSTLAANRALLTTLDRIAHESGFLAHLLAMPDSRDRLASFRAFVRDAEEFSRINRDARVHDLIEYLTLLETHKLSIKAPRPSVHTPLLRLMTAHRSKGLEFDHVFIIGAYDGHWGNARSVEHFSLVRDPSTTDPETDLDDERRLFYVALTRARHSVTVSYATHAASGRAQLPSQFIEEIDAAHRTMLDAGAFEAKIEPAQLLAQHEERHVPVIDRDYLRELFLEQGLSVTAINNYLRSPWEYFFSNLLRIPQAPSKHMLYGNAVHGALRDLYERIREGGEVELEYLLARFEHHLRHTSLSRHEYDATLAKGRDSLAAYWAARVDGFDVPFATEYSLTSRIMIDDGLAIPLRGILDRVIMLPDGRVHVVDYKTGKPKSRNHIEGKTKTDGAGDYKRQLVFYKFLLSQQAQHSAQGLVMETGEVDFVEPDEKGRIRDAEVFHITDEEVGTLTNEIKRIAREIYDLSFWDAACEEKNCSYEDLVRFVKQIDR